MKITREIKAAILVIASILLFIWGYSFLKGRDLFTSYKTFYVEYDNVEGLASSAPVTINGLPVGKIMGITLMPNTGKLKVEIQVKSDFPISKSSTIDIYEPGLIGGKQIQIVPNLKDSELAESGHFFTGKNVPGLTSLVAEKLSPLQEKIEKVAESTTLLLDNLNEVLNTESKQNLRESIAKVNMLLAQLEKMSATANTIVQKNQANIDGSLSNFNKSSANLAKLSDTLVAANLGETLKSLQQSMKKVDVLMANLEKGEGTMGKLLTDDLLYKNLNATSSQLELLLEDLRLNPTRYVNVSLFGKKNKPYIAPVKQDSISK